MDAMEKYLFIFITVFLNVVQIDAVTVNPLLCPTNKIAPHRRHANWENSKPRTLGLIYELFGPRRPQQIEPLDDLQEQPQEDEQDDCGEIEDYDETDLSSITPGGQRRKTNRNDRYLFDNNNNIPPYYRGTSRQPSMPHRPQRPTRPPYNFGGIYGFRPPTHQYPADHIKPVQEHIIDHPQAAYQPGLIGGALGHIVGYPLVTPTTEETPQIQPSFPFRFPVNDFFRNRHQRISKPTNKSTSIIESFVDLLFN